MPAVNKIYPVAKLSDRRAEYRIEILCRARSPLLPCNSFAIFFPPNMDNSIQFSPENLSSDFPKDLLLLATLRQPLQLPGATDEAVRRECVLQFELCSSREQNGTLPLRARVQDQVLRQQQPGDQFSRLLEPRFLVGAQSNQRETA